MNDLFSSNTVPKRFVLKLPKVILTSTEDALHIGALDKENAFSRLQTQGTIHYFVVL